MKYRQYAAGFVITEEDFDEYDNTLPYYDDYAEVDVPEWVIDYIVDEGKGYDV